MPSRDIRRATRKRAETSKENIAERRRNARPFLYGFTVLVLVIVVVAFIGLPAVRGTGGTPGAKIQFGAYRGVPIEYFPGNFLSDRVEVLAEQLRNQKQQNESQASVDYQSYQVWRTAFEQTLLHEAILYEADKGGLWVSDDKLDQTLITTGPYVVGGQFSEERYRATPQAERYNIRKLYREQLIHEQYLRDFFDNERTSPKEEEFFAKGLDEQRRFTFVTFPFSDYPDSAVRTYGEQHSELFRKMKLSRILIKSSEREAQAIRGKLEERTASFEELARANSKDVYAEKGGDMGYRYLYDLEADFESKQPVEEIFSLQEGQLSPVLKSRFGWVIYRADSPVVPVELNTKEGLDTVRQYVMRYEKGMVEDYMLQQAKEFRGRVNDVGFNGATLERSYKESITDYFPLNYQGYYFLAPVRAIAANFDLSSASYSEEFFLSAFSLKPQEVSQPILLEDQVLVLRLDDIRQAPKQQKDLMGDFYAYYGRQSLQGDLQNILLKPEYITDNFNTAFYKYVSPTR